MILLNQIKCNKCDDVITSTHVHDYKSCKCGRVSVDGGKDYLKRSFTEQSDYQELSLTSETKEEKESGVLRIAEQAYRDKLFKKHSKMINKACAELAKVTESIEKEKRVFIKNNIKLQKIVNKG